MIRDEFDEHQRVLREGYGADISIKCLNGVAKCHKFIFAARSSYFAQKFRTNWAEKSTIIFKSELTTMRPL